MPRSSRLLVLAASALLLASSAFAAPTLDITSFGQSAAFSTDYAFSQAWISVTGPNGYSQKLHIGALEELGFQLGDSAADGLYNWEVLAVQPVGNARGAGDRAAKRVKPEGDVQSFTFSGTFQVRGGVIELPIPNISGERDVPLKAVVVNDDQIVDGSQCVGSDCSASESFGFDTLRLKENNLRIHFNDTSSSGSFPSNDWRLTANDSSNGGLNFFGIEDSTAGNFPFRIEAGAGANALYIEDDGQVGIGTSNPAVHLQVTDGNSPTLRLEQDGSDGFQSQTWDIAGNESNFFVRNVTSSSALPFRILDEATGNTLMLNDTGVGVGTNNNGARAPLHVRGGGSNHDPSNSAVLALFQNNSGDGDGAIISVLAGNGTANAQMWFGDADDDNAGRIIYRNGSDALSFWANGSERLFIQSTGDLCLGGCQDTTGDAIRHTNGAHLTSGGTWTNASSRALKQDIATLSTGDAMAALDQLVPVTFRYKNELDETYVGFIAEDVPELVAMKHRQGLTSMDVVAVLTKVVQEQQKAYDEQRLHFQTTLEALQARLEALETID